MSGGTGRRLLRGEEARGIACRWVSLVAISVLLTGCHAAHGAPTSSPTTSSPTSTRNPTSAPTTTRSPSPISALSSFLADVEDETVTVITIAEDFMEMTFTWPIIINRTLTVEGVCPLDGCALSHDSPGSRMFTLGAGSNVTFRNLNFVHAGVYVERNGAVAFHSCTFTGPSDGCDGGSQISAVQVGEAYATFDNCTFNGTRSDGDGGAVHLQGSTARFTSCRFLHTATCGSSSNGGALYAEQASVILASCVFLQTEASGDGGAVYVQSSGMEMTNCTFNRTSSGPSGSGGAVYVHDTNEVVRITSCNFVETEASGNGGAVYAWWPTVDANNMVDANYMSMDMTGCTFDGTRTRDNGGAVSVLGGDVVRITSCSFNQTEASGNGGAVHVESSGIAFRSCDFVQTEAGSRGGAVYCLICDSTFTGCTFDGTRADDVGGAISVETGALRVEFCDFVKTTAGLGGGAIQSESAIALSSSNFLGTTSDQWGGAVHLYEGGFSSLVNCTFQNTSAFQDGGAIHADETQNIDVTACNFLGTVAGRNGGAVHLIGLEGFNLSSLVNCTFQNTSAVQDGGAIHAEKTLNIDVTACNFLGTVAGRNGGAVHLIGESTISASLRSCAFEATSSKVSGGAIYSESTRPLSVQGCTIIAAVAGDEGGGLWMGAGANLNLTASSFKDNSATFGGAVFGFQATSLHMDAVHFSDNVVRASGGAILCRACETVEVHGSSLLKNSAAIGAAIYADDLAGTSIISNTSFSNNTATGQGARGGAILLEQMTERSANTTVGIFNVRFDGNSARSNDEDQSVMIYSNPFSNAVNSHLFGCGGALTVLSRSPQQTSLELDGVSFDSNRGYKGGGLCVTGQSLKLTMSAATFSHNEARFGGAIFGHQASEVRLANCSFEENGWLPSTALTLPDSESYAVGGALALEAAATTQVAMSGVTFKSNHASNREAVFIDDAAAARRFECDACNTSVLPPLHWEEQCIHYGLPPPLVMSMPSQLVPVAAAPPFAILSPPQGEFREILALGKGGLLGLYCLVLDLFGTPLCEFDQMQIIISVQEANSSILLDSRRSQQATFERGRADFSLLLVTGDLDDNATLTFEVPELNITAQVRITIKLCTAYEYEQDGICRSCPEGELIAKGDDGVNSGCISCVSSVGIHCYGGLSVDINEGYWLAPEAARCDSGDCVLARLYQCEEVSACNSAASNGTIPLATAMPLAQSNQTSGQCSYGYRSDVVQCAKCLPGYFSSNSDGGGNGACKKCTGGKAKAMAQFLGVLVLALLVMIALYTFFVWAIKRGGSDKVTARVLEYMDNKDDALDSAGSAIGLWQITLGTTQVLGQMYALFRSRIPPYMSSFLSSLSSIINLDFFSLMNTTCLVYSLGFKNTHDASSFYATLVWKACIPFIILAVYMLGSGLCKSRMRRHAGDPEMAKLYGEYHAGLTVCCVFMSTLMHPSVSTAMFETFQCEQSYFDSSSDLDSNIAPFWNVNDMSIQCFVGTYWIFAGVSMAMVFVYVLGWPLMVFFFLKHHHDMRAVHLVQGAASDYDRAKVVGLNPPLRNDYLQYQQQPVAMDTNEGASEAGSDDISALLFSKYISQTATECETTDPDAPVKHVAWLRVRSFKWWESIFHFAKLSTPSRAGDLWVQLEVEPLMKRDVSDGGAVIDVPVNILDCDPQLGLYAKPFVRLFEDQYYYWGTVEILRKLFQTSFVVIIRIVDERFDLLYTLTVNVIAITLQGHYSPYQCDIDDKLSVLFLVNEFFLIVSLLGVTHMDGWNEHQNGAVLLAMQGLLFAYLTYVIWTVKARPLYQGYKERCAGMLEKYSDSRKQTKGVKQDGRGKPQMQAENVIATPTEAPPVMMDNIHYDNDDVVLSMVSTLQRE